MITDKLRTALSNQAIEAGERFGNVSVFELHGEPGYALVKIGSGEGNLLRSMYMPENVGYQSLEELMRGIGEWVKGEKDLRRVSI